MTSTTPKSLPVMKVFTDRNVQFFGSLLPIYCPMATFPQVIFAQKLEKPIWEEGDVISFINTDIYYHPSIDFASIFSRARESDHAPSLEERRALEQLLVDCKADIQALNSKIPETFVTITKLCQEVSEATSLLVRKLDQVNMTQYILSPPKHLPYDILEQIFLWSTGSSVDITAEHLVPRRLASVCRRWRSVALSMSSLWNQIRVDLNDKKSIHIAKICLSRCRSPSLMLKLRKNGFGKRNISVAEDFMAFLNGLTIQVPQLSVELDRAFQTDQQLVEIDDVNSIPEGLLSFVQHHLTNAEELVLLETYRLQSLDAPQVKRLYLKTLPDSWSLQPGPSESQNGFPPLHRLTVLYIRGDIPVHVADIILSRCPSLQRLHVVLKLDERGDVPPLSSHHTGDIQIHECLNYLSILHSGVGDVPPALLHGWRFPKLQTFFYRSQREAFSCQWLLNHPLLSDIRHLILTFESGQHNPDIFMSILRVTPFLESLVLYGQYNEVLVHLVDNLLGTAPAAGNGDSAILGCLKKLSVVFTFGTSFMVHFYGPVLQKLYTAAVASLQLSHLIIEVGLNQQQPERETLSSFLSYIKNDVDTR